MSKVEAKEESVGNGLFRVKVPGGWLVSLYSNAICFYPDPEHLWLKDDKTN